MLAADINYCHSIEWPFATAACSALTWPPSPRPDRNLARRPIDSCWPARCTRLAGDFRPGPGEGARGPLVNGRRTCASRVGSGEASARPVAVTCATGLAYRYPSVCVCVFA